VGLHRWKNFKAHGSSSAVNCGQKKPIVDAPKFGFRAHHPTEALNVGAELFFTPAVQSDQADIETASRTDPVRIPIFDPSNSNRVLSATDARPHLLCVREASMFARRLTKFFAQMDVHVISIGVIGIDRLSVTG
jgi:hypothetical protein